MEFREEVRSFLKNRERPVDTAIVALNDPRVTTSPDQAAADQSTARQLNIPSAAFDDSTRPLYDRLLQDRRNKAALANTTALPLWLQNPENAAIARDDIENLSALEGGLNAVERGGRRLYRSAQALNASQIGDLSARRITHFDRIDDLGLKPGSSQQEIARALDLEPFHPDTVTALIYANGDDRTRRKLRESNTLALQSSGARLQRAGQKLQEIAEIPMTESASAFRDSLFEAPSDDLGEILAVIASDPFGAASFFAQTAAETAPTIAVAAGAATVGGPAAGAGVLALGSFTAEAGSEAVDFLAEEGVDFSSPEAVLAALQDGDLIAKANERGLTRGLIIAGFDLISGGIAGQQLARSAAGNLVLQTVTQAFLGGSGEATAQLTLDGEVDLREVVVEALAETITAPVEVAGIAGRSLLKDGNRAANSGRTAEALQGLDEAIGKSALAQRSPEKFRDFLDGTTLGDQFLYVPAEALRTYYQAKDINVDEALTELGVSPDTFEEAALSGGDIAIPATVYASKISGSEDAAFFHENATLDPDESSLSEAELFNEEVGTLVREASEEAAQAYRQDREARASDQQVFDGIFTQLRAAGRTADVAEREASVWQAFFRSLGDRYGEDALDLARQFGARIQGVEGRVEELSAQALRQPIKVEQDRSAPVPTVSVTTEVESAFSVAALKSSFESHLKGKEVQTPTGVPVRFSRASRKLISSNRRDSRKAAVIPHLAEVIASAPIYAELADKKGRDNLTIAKAAGAVEIDGQVYAVDLTYRVSRDDTAVAYQFEGFEVSSAGISGNTEASPQPFSAEDNLKLSDLIEAFNGDALFQEARGSITFPRAGIREGETVINLFESADLSTFLHESGHFFLEAFNEIANREDAPEAIRADLDTINKFLGREGSEEFTVEQHEKWARGFEAYALEGKAPSLELADAFARFRAWLTRIYRSLAGLNVKLNDEIRAVMDRMLATDDEIRIAREEQAMSPLFTDAKQAGMSDAEFKAYQRLARRSQEQAEQSLLERTMEKIRRERTKEYKENKDAVTKEVTEEVNRRREHRLIELLANSKWLGPDEISEIPDVRMDRDALVETFGEGILEEISRQSVGGKRAIYGKEGLPLVDVADMFAFDSVDEMIRVLQNTGKRKDVIAAEVEQRLVERYGDVLNDGSIEEEALLAIHSEQQAVTVATEARQLAKQAGHEHRNITAKVFRQRARLMIGRMSVRQASRPNAFLQAERKAARAAQQALARVTATATGKKDGAQEALTAALRHKEAQVLNHYLYLEARDIERRVENGRKRMRAYDKPATRKRLAGGYIEQIDQLLEDYDFRRKSPADLARRKSLKQYIDEMVAAGRGNELYIDQRLIDEAQTRHYTDLTVDELNGLFDTIANIDHMGRTKQKLIDRAGERDREQAIQDVVGAIGGNLGTGKNRTGFTDPKQVRGEAGREILLQMLNADSIIREADGFEDLGPLYRNLKESIDGGFGRLRDMERDAAETMDEIYSVYKGELGRFDMKREIKGVSEPVSKADALSLALNWGNDGNRAAVLDSKRFTQDEVELILASLDKRDWEFVQKSWDFIDSFWSEISAVEERVTGVRPEKIEARSFVTKHGVVRGGYYPLKYDGAKDGRARDETIEDILDQSRNGLFGKAATKRGFANERVGSGGRPIRFGLDIMASHAQQVMHHIALGEAVASTHKVLNSRRVKEAFIDAGRATDHLALEAWLKDVAAGEIAASGSVNKILRGLRAGLSVSAMGFNVWTTTLQFTGLFQSAVVIGKGPMLRGMGRMAAAMAASDTTIEELVYSRSPLMKARGEAFNKDIRDALRDMKDGIRVPFTENRYRVIPPWVQRNAFWMIVKAQRFVDVATWLGAYEAGSAQFDNENDAILFADRMVERAQGSPDLSGRTGVERGTIIGGGRIQLQQAEWVKTFTPFMSYMLAKFNVAYERSKKLQQNFADPKEWANYITDMAFLFTVEALVIGLIRGELPEEEDEETTAGYLAKQTGLTMLGTIPMARDIGSALQGFGGGSSATRGFETFGNLAVQASQAELDTSFVKSLNSAGGLLLKYPSSQINRLIDGISRSADGEDVLPIEYLIRLE